MADGRPATKQDLIELENRLKREILEGVQEMFRAAQTENLEGVREMLRAAQTENLERVQEMVCDAQTEILKAFFPVQERTNLRLQTL